ncbi:phosphate regulon sensor histidine kinase PhoR [Marinomonas sp. PE14-40]|uniref:phosphate regulon sensor histidine kinase PhoR n=1 Tax=Marinomonas sp. PE14-40 TaxID=3060621 RepID=UPI003F680F5D
MKTVWKSATVKLLLGFFTCLFIGMLSEQTFPLLFLYVLSLLCWQFYELYRFHSWIRRSGRSLPPDSSGIWGDVFDAVNRLQKKQRKSKKRMQQALARIEDSTSALQDGVIMADNTGRLEWWNTSAGDLLGLVKPTDRSQPLTNIVRTPEFFRYFSQKRFGDPLVIQSPAKEGTFLEFQTTLYSKNDHLIFVRDVTRLHLLEQMRKDFVANASHELKTPLTVIKGYLETLDMFKESLPERMQKGVVNMNTQSNRMELLIEDLLLLSRLESNQRADSDQWHNVSDLIQVICDSAKVFTTSEHFLSWDADEESSIFGSYSELYSAFSNLVVNALKYSPDGGEIDISWQVNKDGGIFCVQDNGLGIDPRFIPRLTERFFRIDKGRGSDTAGTGLGLSIVKHVLHHHDSKLDISSQLGFGSTFSCHFPRTRVRESSTPEIEAIDKDAS